MFDRPLAGHEPPPSEVGSRLGPPESYLVIRALGPSVPSPFLDVLECSLGVPSSPLDIGNGDNPPPIDEVRSCIVRPVPSSLSARPGVLHSLRRLCCCAVHVGPLYTTLHQENEHTLRNHYH